MIPWEPKNGISNNQGVSPKVYEPKQGDKGKHTSFKRSPKSSYIPAPKGKPPNNHACRNHWEVASGPIWRLRKWRVKVWGKDAGNLTTMVAMTRQRDTLSSREYTVTPSCSLGSKKLGKSSLKTRDSSAMVAFTSTVLDDAPSWSGFVMISLASKALLLPTLEKCKV